MTDRNDVTPLIVSVAPTGPRRTRDDHPALPIEPADIARTAAECREAGAAMIHLHVRDKNGGHLLDADAYREATAAVRGEVGDDLIIQVTTESVGLYGPEKQMSVIRELRPEAVSVAVRELCPDLAMEAEAGEFFAWMRAEKIMPQYILYSEGDVARFADLWRRGVVPGDRAFVLFVLGRYSRGQVSSPADILPFITAAHPMISSGRALEWSIGAFGKAENTCAVTAAALGGHARVGFENNLYMADGTLAKDNAALVRQLSEGAVSLGRPLADAAAAKKILEIP